MPRRRAVLALIVAVPVAGSLCADDLTPTHAARIVLPTSRYGEFNDKLNAEMWALGFTRYSGPGIATINRSKGREILFAAYKLEAADRKAFLTVTDIVRPGQLEVQVFAQALPQAKSREALARVAALVKAFGGELRPSS